MFSSLTLWYLSTACEAFLVLPLPKGWLGWVGLESGSVGCGLGHMPKRPFSFLEFGWDGWVPVLVWGEVDVIRAPDQYLFFLPAFWLPTALLITGFFLFFRITPRS